MLANYYPTGSPGLSEMVPRDLRDLTLILAGVILGLVAGILLCRK